MREIAPGWHELNLSGKRVLVTGGAVRLGRAICELLAARGCLVGIHYNRSGREAMEFLMALRKQGHNAFAVQADLSIPSECEELLEAAWSEGDGLDILVNNAAVFIKDNDDAASPKTAAQQMQVNYLSPVDLAGRFAGRVRLAGSRGSIVNMLDTRIARDDGDSSSYTASKKKLAEFTLRAASEFAPNLAVNGIAPGAILPPPRRDGHRTREPAGAKLLDHKCTPQDIASAVAFLLESDGITGQIIYVDSGQHLL